MNENLLGSRIACGNTAYKRSASDYYPTPPDVTKALLNYLKLSAGTKIWEPACGTGHITNILKEYGYLTFSTDIEYQGCGYGEVNFLTAEFLPGTEWIITNPPFSLAKDFICRCNEHDIPFALLLKSQYWHAKSRLELFREIPPSEILPLTWRPDFMFGERGGSPLMDCIWCVWRRSNGKTLYQPLERPKGENDD